MRSNRKWKYENLSCVSCKENVEETQSHVLICKELMRRNDLYTYIPNYIDIYQNDLDEIIYISTMLKEHMKIRESILNAQEGPTVN